MDVAEKDACEDCGCAAALHQMREDEVIPKLPPSKKPPEDARQVTRAWRLPATASAPTDLMSRIVAAGNMPKGPGARCQEHWLGLGHSPPLLFPCMSFRDGLRVRQLMCVSDSILSYRLLRLLSCDVVDDLEVFRVRT